MLIDYLKKLVSSLATWAQIIVAVFMVFCIFNHTGRVCSGDFLRADESTEGYLVTEGLIIEILAYAWAACFAIITCIALVKLFLKTS